jgi:hypothetical protein
MNDCCHQYRHFSDTHIMFRYSPREFLLVGVIGYNPSLS